MNKDEALALAQMQLTAYAQQLPLIEQIGSFEARVLIYGVPDETGTVLTRQAALAAFDQLKIGATREVNGLPWSVVSKRIEGDEQRGYGYATFQRKEP